MKILHIGDVAGIPLILAKAQRKLGYKSDVLSYQRHPFDYGVDYCFPLNSGFPINHIEKMIIFSKFLSKYDVYHFHGGTLLPKGIDSVLWKYLKKKLVIHHHGSDIRYTGEKLIYSKFADKIFVSTPDLLEWSPCAIWIPNPISLDSFHYVGVENKVKSENINIVHAPSNRAKKGTEYILKAINKLKNEGYKINLILVENMPHNKAIEYYKKADIVIDQLLIGWYGLFAVECMALGKPVCVYIRDDLESYMPFNPIINTSSTNIAENLRILIEDGRLRKEVGDKGRKYVEEMHDAKEVAKEVIRFYNVDEITSGLHSPK
ncbi:MAG: glycosyltransferase family 4 protein [Candidatus Methanoperedens sp.]|nr:glycosyltransferase family 4 protein [Candidatus Methanoperedens sp.]MCZ7370603.1 glycosyltransferase family 4 protein [Candidatus Methanoperedens sp.]